MLPSPSSELTVATPLGPARAYVHPAAQATTTLVLGHGAGTGVQRSPDLLALAAALPAVGVTVVLLDQPWVVAGQRVAPAPPRLDVAWLAALEQLQVTGALVLGGRSAGARVACRTAAALGASGVLALAFPLHPPGRPERSRAGELTAVRVPLLVVQGETDSFGGPAEVRAALGSRDASAPAEVCGVPGDHGFRVGKTAGLSASDVRARITEAVAGWLTTLPRS